MTPQTVNAYYNPGFNEIVFPAAILQPPFFDAGRDEAANYGSDRRGDRARDRPRLRRPGFEVRRHGEAAPTGGRPSDREAFEERTQALIEQYNALSPAQTPELHVNGALTVGENIGDLGGLAIAWKAYLLSLNGEEPPVIDGLTGAQRFFFAWARDLAQEGAEGRGGATPGDRSALAQRVPMQPDRSQHRRVLRRLRGDRRDALWLAPAERVTIW